MKPTRLLLILLLACVFSTIAAAGDAPPSLPRYSFDIGRQLKYSGHGEFKYQGGGFQDTSSCQLTVVAKNADGSFHVIVRSGSRHLQNRDDAHAAAIDAQPENVQPENVRYTALDIMPDGKVVSDATGSSEAPPSILPLLPADPQQLHTTWTQPSIYGDSTQVFSDGSTESGSVWIFKSDEDGLMKKIYGIANDSTYRFDLSKGMVISIASESRQDYGFKGSGTASTVLDSDQTLPADQVALLARDFATLQAAEAAFHARLKSVDKTPDDSAAILASARADLTAAAATVTTPEIKQQMDKLPAGAEQQIQYQAEEAKRIAAVVGQPAPDFSANDLEGRPHKLSDYRGKVVLLDFWYRGCGWCIRAMPQINKLADDFKDKPVVVIGLNTDQNAADAKFVVDALGLNYTTLHIDQDTVGKFQVQGFPTLLLIDPAGVVREFHVGYSPTLRADIGKKVQGLLDAAGSH